MMFEFFVNDGHIPSLHKELDVQLEQVHASQLVHGLPHEPISQQQHTITLKIKKDRISIMSFRFASQIQEITFFSTWSIHRFHLNG